MCLSAFSSTSIRLAHLLSDKVCSSGSDMDLLVRKELADLSSSLAIQESGVSPVDGEQDECMSGTVCSSLTTLPDPKRLIVGRVMVSSSTLIPRAGYLREGSP